MASTKSSSGSAQSKTKSSSAPKAEPTIPNYDAQTADEVTRRLRKLSQADLAKLESYERKGQSRTTVLARIAALRGEAPWSGYDDMEAEEVNDALKNRDGESARAVLDYERQHKARTTIIEFAERKRDAAARSAAQRRGETARARLDHGRARASGRHPPSRAPGPRARRANALPHPRVEGRTTSRHLVRAARRPVARRVRGRLVAAPPRQRRAGHGPGTPPGRPPAARRVHGAARARRRAAARSRARAGPAGRPAPREPAPLGKGPTNECVRPRQPPLGGGWRRRGAPEPAPRKRPRAQDGRSAPRRKTVVR